PIIKVVRGAHENDRILPGFILRAIHIGSHALTVAHRDHQLAIDYGNGFKLFFFGVAIIDELLALLRRLRLLRLSKTANAYGDENKNLKQFSHGSPFLRRPELYRND